MVCFIIAGVVQVPVAKFLDLTGRMEGLILMVFFMELGMFIEHSIRPLIVALCLLLDFGLRACHARSMQECRDIYRCNGIYSHFR